MSGSTVVDVASGRVAALVKIDDPQRLERASGRASRDRLLLTLRAGARALATSARAHKMVKTLCGRRPQAHERTRWSRRFAGVGRKRERSRRSRRLAGVSRKRASARDGLDTLWVSAASARTRDGLDALRASVASARALATARALETVLTPYGCHPQARKHSSSRALARFSRWYKACCAW
jgi:hypothetical protein